MVCCRCRFRGITGSRSLLREELFKRLHLLKEGSVSIIILMVIVDRGPWYRWALERLGIEYRV